MIIYSIISIICACIMLGTFAYIVAKIFILDRAERIGFIRDFKKGKVAIVYLVAVPLYFMANYYSGIGITKAIGGAFEGALTLLTFIIDRGNTAQLAQANAIYQATLYLCYGMVYLNGLMFIVSLCNENIWAFFISARFHISKETKCIIIGNNPDNEIIYETCKEKYKIFSGELDKAAKTELYLKNIRYKSFIQEETVLNWAIKESVRLSKKYQKRKKRFDVPKQKVILIINTKSDEHNLKLCGHLVKKILEAKKFEVEFLEAYVFANVEHTNVYAEYEKRSKGCLQQVNKYTLGAIEFIDKYPLTQYMNERHIDYETSLLKDDVHLNVAFIGFGKQNRQMFLSSVANNQFFKKDANGNNQLYPVHYHIFDKEATENDKNLNHTYCRYRHNFIDVKPNGDYLDLPPLPAKEDYCLINVNSIAFYDKIKELIGKGEQDLTYLIIAIGDDLINVDLGNKLLIKLNEWGFKNVQVFVNVEEKAINQDLKKVFPFDNCHVFGDKYTSECNYYSITGDKFSKMAIQRNFIYDVENDLKHKKDLVLSPQYLYEKFENSQCTWHVKRTHIERESNLYGCLSLRQKLHLMGLDYCKTKEAKGLTYDEYMQIYAKDDLPKLYGYNLDLKKSIIEYDLNFKNSRRKTMAEQEHYRWNAYMITKGFVPSEKKIIREEKDDKGKPTNGKSYTLRRHGNLTTMDGLVEFRKILAERNNSSELNEDVIKYDYQLLDDAYWLLTQNGYSIIKRNI